MTEAEAAVKKCEATWTKFETDSKALMAFYGENPSRKPEEFVALIWRFAKEFEVCIHVIMCDVQKAVQQNERANELKKKQKEMVRD